MLRLSELRLPLDHNDEDLTRALLRQLRIPPDHLLEQHLVKRSVDARRRDRIQLIYSLDVRVKGGGGCASQALPQFKNPSHSRHPLSPSGDSTARVSTTT